MGFGATALEGGLGQVNRRIVIGELTAQESEGQICHIVGRLVQLSPATLTLEDMTDRRTFGFRNDNPDLARVRIGDLLELKLEFHHKAWRAIETQVLSPCLLTEQDQRRWMQRWFLHSNRLRKNLHNRDRITRTVREYFHQENFLEVQTPTLVPCPGMEPHLEGFQTVWEGPNHLWKKTLFLPTSPEFHLKKLLSLGYEKIFEFSKSFRNGELSGHHQPEFTMLEWYRAYESYERLMEDIENLVFQAAMSIPKNGMGKAGVLHLNGKDISLAPPWKRLSIRQLFLDVFRVDLDKLQDGPDLARAARFQGFTYVSENESFEDTFFRLLLTEVEPKLGWDRPVILYDYPVELAALSRRKPQNKRYCERFEVYIAGTELANAFGELTNPNEQARRFSEFTELAMKERGYHYEVDGEFMDALKFGLPPSTGIALGFDRLVMLLCGENSLDAVMAFPHQAPITGNGK